MSTAKSILVIDDEEDIRTVVYMALELTTPWSILLAANGAEGVALAKQFHPDAVLLDVTMPEMDGPTTFKTLQACEQTQSIPVLLLTAKVQSIDQKAFADLAVAGLLFKPFDPLKLADEIAACLGWESPTQDEEDQDHS